MFNIEVYCGLIMLNIEVYCGLIMFIVVSNFLFGCLWWTDHVDVYCGLRNLTVDV